MSTGAALPGTKRDVSCERMIPDPAKLPQLAKKRQDENYRFRDFLKHHSGLGSEEVDRLVQQISAEVWKRVDCTECGNCCREVSPTLNENEVTDLACHLGINNADLISKYLRPAEKSEESPWLMRQKPCPLLRDNRCSVYEHRPGNCRAYPYLDQPDFVFRTWSMMDRLSVCPAVFEVWEQLKRATGFRFGAGGTNNVRSIANR